MACGGGAQLAHRSLKDRTVNEGWVGPGRGRKSTRPEANGVVELSPFEFLDRLADLVPPPRKHWHRYHGVFAPNHKLRRAVTALGPSAIDLGSDRLDRIEDRNAAGHRVHEDLDRAREMHGRKLAHERSEVKRPATGHLEKLVVLLRRPSLPPRRVQASAIHP